MNLMLAEELSYFLKNENPFKKMQEEIGWCVNNSKNTKNIIGSCNGDSWQYLNL